MCVEPDRRLVFFTSVLKQSVATLVPTWVHVLAHLAGQAYTHRSWIDEDHGTSWRWWTQELMRRLGWPEIILPVEFVNE
ncbi:unnamed protein product [Bursaphelenchus xylophilus]|uniref:(pine wood nematode) hypothetical protein n=1 Tax=Bursaphelenchus xylophilus TaxID=6326 RepID=A0A1I7S1T7_BURXY|nr:unnamed protein product [Bursaphelenchus xylophilus]CAG9089937.1 unnamed protein product [Bursaphelenchus xylophilus]